MRQGCYELIVLRSDDSSFEEVVVDGKYFLRAESGTEYKVKFIINRDDFGNFPFQHAVCILSADGTNTDSGAYLDLNLDSTFETRHVIFRGFRVDSDLLQAFVFSDLVAGSGSVNGTSKAGMLQVSVYEAERFQPRTNIYPPSFTAPSLRTISEDKKFWQQPSLATVRGKDLMAHYSAADFRCMRQVPDATCLSSAILQESSTFYRISVESSTPVRAVWVSRMCTYLTDEPNPVSPEPAPVSVQPVVVNLCDDQAQNQDEIETEIEKGKPQVVKKYRRSTRIAKKMRADENMIVQEDKEEVEVKVEKKSVNKKKKIVEVVARRKRSSKMARTGDSAGAEKGKES